MAAIALILIKPTRPPAPPRYRYVEAIHRNPDGSLGVISMQCFNLDAPVDDFHGMPDGETYYRETIARLRAAKVQFTVTRPRGFHPDGRPIY